MRTVTVSAEPDRIDDDELQRKLWSLFSRPPMPKLSRATTALLSIDLQFYNAHPEFGLGVRAAELGISDFLRPYFHELSTRILPNVRLLQDAARRNRVELIHIRVASITRDGRDSTLRYKRMGLRKPAHTKGAEILPEVAPMGDEILINKTTSSAFNSTNIDRLLRNLGIRDLIITGVVTNGCVESTARSAAEYDYGVIVVSDATGAMAPQLHEHSLLNLGYKDAVIMTTMEVIQALDNLDSIVDVRAETIDRSG